MSQCQRSARRSVGGACAAERGGRLERLAAHLAANVAAGCAVGPLSFSVVAYISCGCSGDGEIARVECNINQEQSAHPQGGEGIQRTRARESDAGTCESSRGTAAWSAQPVPASPRPPHAAHTHTQARRRARPAYATRPGCMAGQYKIRHKKSITIRIIPRIRWPGSPAYCPTLRRGAGRVGRTTHERRQKKEIGKRKDSRCKRSVGCLAPRRSTRRRKSSIRKCWEMAVPLRSSLVLLAVASSHAALQRASNKRVRALIAPVISAVPTRPCPLRAGARRQPCTEKAMQI